MAVTREQLYEEVWSEPMSKVAERHGVSGSYLARVCSQLNVPRPPRGYWAKLAAGKKAERPPLPDAKPGEELEWARDGMPRRKPHPLPRPPAEGEGKPPGRRRSRRTRHPLVIGAEEHFEVDRETREGLLKPRKRLLVDVCVSKKMVRRGLNTASKLFLAIEERGHDVTIAAGRFSFRRPTVDPREGKRAREYWDGWAPCRPTVAFFGTVAIGLTVYEASEEAEVRYQDGDWVRVGRSRKTRHADSWTHVRDVASGRLVIRAFSPYQVAEWVREWREEKPNQFKDQLDDIAQQLEEAAPVVAAAVAKGRRESEKRQRRWEEECRERERQAAIQRRKAALSASREQLLELVSAWSLARELDAFFENMSTAAATLDPAERERVQARLDEARSLFGGTAALDHFRNWKSPDERL